ncbi:MAG: response regulator [Nitrospinota bacterium]|jgi:CheY-like chemotaxis protein|nr:response regulator [Nitrospinota bacterium]
MNRRSNTSSHGRKPLILIIGEVSKSSLDQALSTHGYQTTHEEDPARGLQSAERHWPDLVLLNLRSSDAAGCEFLQNVRDLPHLNHLPVVIIMNDNKPEIRMNALEIGADDCISRPYDAHELLGRIDAVLRRTLQQMTHRRIQTGLVNYLAGHYQRRGYEVFSPYLPETPAVSGNWRGPPPDLTIVRDGRTIAVGAESIQSLLREDTPDRWIAFLENDIEGLWIVVRDRASGRIANRIRKALKLPFQVSRVRHRSESLETPKIRSLRLKKKQRRAIAIGGVAIVLRVSVGLTHPGSVLLTLGSSAIEWFVLQAKHYQPKDIERQLMQKAAAKGQKKLMRRGGGAYGRARGRRGR